MRKIRIPLFSRAGAIKSWCEENGITCNFLHIKSGAAQSDHKFYLTRLKCEEYEEKILTATRKGPTGALWSAIRCSVYFEFESEEVEFEFETGEAE